MPMLFKFLKLELENPFLLLNFIIGTHTVPRITNSTFDKGFLCLREVGVGRRGGLRYSLPTIHSLVCHPKSAEGRGALLLMVLGFPLFSLFLLP